jgi:hypothetical protein
LKFFQVSASGVESSGAAELAMPVGDFVGVTRARSSALEDALSEECVRIASKGSAAPSRSASARRHYALLRADATG